MVYNKRRVFADLITLKMSLRDVGEFDFRLQHPFSLIVSGPSNSGKTYFVKMLIENVDKIS